MDALSAPKLTLIPAAPVKSTVSEIVNWFAPLTRFTCRESVWFAAL